MRDVIVYPSSLPFVGNLSIPGDKSISHRALILSSLANGKCEISHFLPSEDCLSTMNVLRDLGIKIIQKTENQILVEGRGGKFFPPKNPLNCGNSGTSMRLLSGILVAQSFKSTLTGDSSLSSRPMQRIIEPLEKMGASIFSAEGARSPLEIKPVSSLSGISYVMPIASAQVKSAILLAGLYASGDIFIKQVALSRDHTERMLSYYGVDLEIDGLSIHMKGGQTLSARNFVVPSDISSAAFWIVAAIARGNSYLKIKNVGINPSRLAFLKVLDRMGESRVEIQKRNTLGGELIGDISVYGGNLKGTDILPSEVPNLIDEIPILMVAGALASGKTTVRGAKELRFKESDRISAMAQNLSQMGIKVQEYEDGLSVEGGLLKGGRVRSFGDHRIAISCAIAGLFSKEKVIIENGDCVDISYPEFYQHLIQWN